MSIKEVIRNSLTESASFSELFTLSTVLGMLLVLAVSLVFGLLICLVYNRFYRGVVYSRSFAVTLVGMTVLCAAVTLAISSNVVVSLGMVGALSIVRYRTAVKEPLDIMYLFWAITTGIAAGAKIYSLCLVAFVIMFAVILIFNGRGGRGNVYIAVVHYGDEADPAAIEDAMAGAKYRVKSKTLRGEQSEAAFEVFVKNNDMSFAGRLRAVEGVSDVTVIRYDGEYHG